MPPDLFSQKKDISIKECLWMQAGVVHRKMCENNYSCAECSFNTAMDNIADENMELRKKGEKGQGNRNRIVSWREKLRALPISRRPCTHSMKGRIEFRACTNDYRCIDCEFGQYFDDHYAVHATVKPMDLLEVEGIKIPQGYYFHKGHTWMKIEEGISVLVGIDDFAHHVLGPGDSIEGPLLGKEVKQGALVISLIRGDDQAGFLSPVTGVVTAVNQNLRENGDLAEKKPYSNGWVVRIQATNLRKDLKNLMINEETDDFIKSEVGLLHRVIEAQAGPLAADGGMLAKDIFGNMPELSWESLVMTFLHT